MSGCHGNESQINFTDFKENKAFEPHFFRTITFGLKKGNAQ